MTLLAASARRRGGAPPPDPDTVPYTLPTAAPYNAPVYSVTPTPDGTGSTIHPSVIDTVTGWNGYRYWMSHTPYYLEDSQQENPCILASHDGFHWETPAGASNPLDPAPAEGYNSDSNITLVDGTMYLIWRWFRYNRTLWVRSSTDGVNWTPKVLVDEGAYGDPIAPTLVYHESVWRMWTTGGVGGVRVRTSSTIFGPWADGYVDCTFVGTPPPSIWHVYVTRHAGQYWMLIDSVYLATSLDGITWTGTGAGLSSAPDGAWDQAFYRGSMQPSLDGNYMQVWYSGGPRNPASNHPSWRVGYTQIPLSAWPTPLP